MKKGREKSINSADFLTSNGAYQKYNNNKKYVTMCINNITPNGKIKKKKSTEKSSCLWYYSTT